MLLIACLVLAPRGVAAAQIIGIARVLDGNTLEIYGLHIQLAGIDAPLVQQLCQQDRQQWRCGESAMEALDRFLARRLVTCFERDIDRLGRTVAACYVGSRDIGSWMVAEGWAINERGSTAYLAEEQSARVARRGIWSSRFVAPWNLSGSLSSGWE